MEGAAVLEDEHRPGLGRSRHECRTSFSASRDGSLKDVDRRRDLISGRRRYRHAMDDAGRVLSRAEELAQGFLAGLR